MTALKLYDYWRSSAAYRVRIGLNLKGIAYESVPINIAPGKDEQLTDAYRAKNPQQRVPALETPHGVLTQSLAILSWLDTAYPEPSFLPADPWAAAQARSFALTIATDIHPLNNLAPLAWLRDKHGADEAAIADWYRHWIRRGFDALEVQLGAMPETAFAFGDAPTIADICLVPQCANARRFKLDFAPFPRLAALDERARAHPAFERAAPERQKDAVKG
ncbi:MAG: maleylacetoacetate isomerase [Hyphomonadaceae bacterium]|nr:maleylacetoacetate isomerase [Hyphomonadaceae bacterium]